MDDLFKRNEITKVLQEIFIFKSMKAEQVERVVMALEQRVYNPGDYLFKQGDESTHFFLIQSGSIEVSKDFGDGFWRPDYNIKR